MRKNVVQSDASPQEKVKKNPWRPREHDRDQIALDLLEWAKKPSSINLNEFCAKADISPQRITDWAKDNALFREAVARAKAHLAYRREDRLSKGQLHLKAYDANKNVYDHFSKAESREESAYLLQIKAEMDAKHGLPPNDMDLTKLAKEIKALRNKINVTIAEADPELQ